MDDYREGLTRRDLMKLGAATAAASVAGSFESPAASIPIEPAFGI